MPRLGRELAGRGLVAHRPDRLRRRADPADAGIDDALREVGVLGEEPEARVERVGAGRAGRGDHGVGIEEVDRVGAVGARHDRADPEPVARARDACRDLAAVGDEDRLDRSATRTGWLKRANRVKRDTPPTTNASRGQLSTRDPALDGPCGRPEPPRDLARAQFVGHRVASVASAPDQGKSRCKRGPMIGAS